MRKLSGFALLVLLALGCEPSGDNQRGVPAGVIPYACVDAEALVLLAFDAEPERRGWGHFGGTARWGESVAQTAARELHEETNCAFSEPSAEQLEGLPSSRSGPFVSFFAEVPYQPISQISQDRPTCPSVERSRWVWVRRVDLIRALVGGGQETQIDTVEGDVDAIHLWPGAASSLRRAVEDGVLPRADPCS